MAIRFTVNSDEGGRELTLFFSQPLVRIGRSRGSDIHLPALEVSIDHAEIRSGVEGDFIIDKSSRNGTMVNGNPIVPARRRLLRDGDSIRICGFVIDYCCGLAAPGDPGMLRARADEYAFVHDLVRGRRKPDDAGVNLVVLNGPQAERKIRLPDPVHDIRIGRDEKSELCLDDASLSREHALLHIDWDGVSIEDAGSKNGIRVNDTVVKYQRLRDGDEIHLGATVLAFCDPESTYLDEVTSKNEKETLEYTDPDPVGEKGSQPGSDADSCESEQTPVPVDHIEKEDRQMDQDAGQLKVHANDTVIIIVGSIILIFSIIILAILFR